MAKAAAGIPADKLECYEKLVATNPTVERKGATMPYTLRFAHICYTASAAQMECAAGVCYGGRGSWWRRKR